MYLSLKNCTQCIAPSFRATDSGGLFQPVAQMPRRAPAGRRTVSLLDSTTPLIHPTACKAPCGRPGTARSLRSGQALPNRLPCTPDLPPSLTPIPGLCYSQNCRRARPDPAWPKGGRARPSDPSAICRSSPDRSPTFLAPHARFAAHTRETAVRCALAPLPALRGRLPRGEFQRAGRGSKDESATRRPPFLPAPEGSLFWGKERIGCVRSTGKTGR